MRLPRSTALRHGLIAVALGVALYVVSGYVFPPFENSQLATAAYTFVAVAGLTLLTGLNGQISLGHGALLAVGAYTAVLLQEEESMSLPLVLLASTVVTALVGVLAGAAAARLHGPYLAGATLALAVGLPAIALRFDEVFGGAEGLSSVPPEPPAEFIANETWYAWVCCVGALLTYFLLANLIRSGVGRRLRAVRDSEVAAELAGIDIGRVKIAAFVVSAAAAGLAGGLYVVVNSLAAPGAFTLVLSVSLLTGAILGGLGSLTGAALGAVILVAIPLISDEVARAGTLSAGVQANLALAFYGLVLILVMIFAPGGITGGIDKLRGKRSRGSGS